MLLKNRIFRFTALGVIVLSFALTGCATKKAVTWGNPETGLILKYDIRQDQRLNYRRSTENIQSTEAMGQSIKTTTKTDSDYIIKGIGTDDQNNFITRVIINDLAINIDNPQTPAKPDTSGLKGKSFGITFSPKGKEVEVSGIDDLPKISMGQSMAPDQIAKKIFSNLLPELPADNLKIGDIWTTPIDNKRKQGQIELIFKGETTSVLDGLETIKGMECVRIKSQGKSTIHGSGNMMGQDVKVNGDTNTTATSYFAYKKGIFVKETVEENSSMKINMGTMETPQTSKGKRTIELVK